MYLLGVVVALAVAFVLSRTLYKKQLLELPFIVEIPPYRLPNLKELLRSMWTPVWEFIHRAGSVILVANVGVWILMNVPYGAPPKETLLGSFATAVQPIFKPLGFGEHWENVAVLVPGFLAKEVVVTSYGTILGVQEKAPKVEGGHFWRDLETEAVSLVKAVFNSVETLISQLIPSGEREKFQPTLIRKIQKLFTPASAIAFMVFILLYTPCAATVAAMWQEFGGRFALLSVLLNLSIAYLISFVAYRFALLFVG
jgi:ferrous iron transport protein B